MKNLMIQQDKIKNHSSETLLNGKSKHTLFSFDKYSLGLVDVSKPKKSKIDRGRSRECVVFFVRTVAVWHLVNSLPIMWFEMV